MNSIKYIGLDVHRDTISVAVLNAEGKLVMQLVIATQASAILEFFHGLRGTLHVTFEEGTHSGWLYDLLVRRVAYLVVCNPRKNALLKAGSKSDAIDARKLAELLRLGYLKPVYHGQNSTAAVKHLGRSYAALTEDTTRTMGRLKALYRSQAIACAGTKALRSTASRRVAGAVARQRAAAAGTKTVSGAGCAAAVAARGEAGAHRGMPQVWRGQAAAHSAVAGADTSCAIDWPSADAAPLPHETAVLGLLRAGAGNAQQCRLSDGGRPTGAAQRSRCSFAG